MSRHDAKLHIGEPVKGFHPIRRGRLHRADGTVVPVYDPSEFPEPVRRVIAAAHGHRYICPECRQEFPWHIHLCARGDETGYARLTDEQSNALIVPGSGGAV
jgi:hypothetical protein